MAPCHVNHVYCHIVIYHTRGMETINIFTLVVSSDACQTFTIKCIQLHLFVCLEWNPHQIHTHTHILFMNTVSENLIYLINFRVWSSYKKRNSLYFFVCVKDRLCVPNLIYSLENNLKWMRIPKVKPWMDQIQGKDNLHTKGTSMWDILSWIYFWRGGGVGS